MKTFKEMLTEELDAVASEAKVLAEYETNLYWKEYWALLVTTFGNGEDVKQ